MSRPLSISQIVTGDEDATGTVTFYPRGAVPYAFQVDLDGGDAEFTVTGKLHPGSKSVNILEVGTSVVVSDTFYMCETNLFTEITISWVDNTGAIDIFAGYGEVLP